MSPPHALSQVFRLAEFRALWAAELLSIVGDQLARVGLAVLVYGRTGSAAWAALTYALTFLPAMAGGMLLGRLADRYRRRELMVLVDLLRAVLVGLMALPGMPLWLLCALLVVVVAVGPPHAAAQGALLPEVLGSRFEAGLAVRQITSQTGQLVGFGLGGVALAVVSPSVALGADALTFAISAVLLRYGLRDRPVARPGPGAGTEPADPEGERVRTDGHRPGRPRRTAARRGALAEWYADTRAGLRAVASEPSRRVLAGLVWLVGCYVVPEGLAAPYAAQLGGGPAVVGLLMAADPAGSVLGAWLITTFVPARLRAPMVGACAVAGGLALGGCLAGPGLLGSALLWGLSGLFSSACLVQAQASFVRATPDELRGRAIGVAASGLVAAQGVAILLAGLFAEWLGARVTVGVTGLAGALVAGVLAWRWGRAAAGAEGIGRGGVPISSGG
ncbi:MAG TPA: MFS transporter [Pseudonocardia sp.]|jgi:MFS family permease|nr:MFS transporter [Pseudonocardia sp.]